MGDTGAVVSAGKNAVENNGLKLPLSPWSIIRDALSPSTIGEETTLSVTQVLAEKGLSEVEAQAFLDNLTISQLQLIKLALCDPTGDENLKDAVSKTYDAYYADYKANTTIAVDPNDRPKLEGIPIPEQDKDSGKLINPTPNPDDALPTHTGHDVWSR
ncbi:hypothetical protein PT273_08230 [Orbaceae bacterium ESL0727]|nr:hypothetical protein [Orbaceae bacterium ESL0727]